jgi:integrase
MLVILANNIHHRADAVFTYVARRTGGPRIRGERYPITYGAFYTAFKAAAAAIGKPKLRVHDLRHTAATRTLRATQNLKLASRQLGHTRIATTERYAHVLDDDLRQGMAASHDPRKITGSEAPSPAKAMTRKGKSK